MLAVRGGVLLSIESQGEPTFHADLAAPLDLFHRLPSS